MKNIIYTFISLILFCACTEQNKNNKQEKGDTKEFISESDYLSIDNRANLILSDWLDYYKSLDSSFSIDKFYLDHTDSIVFMDGSVLGIFDKGFNHEVYNDFIVLSPNKRRYIDFDSYQWRMDENNVPVFSPDQEVNLVDIDRETVTRIGFNATSQWVENAYWKDDKTIILLENSTEGILSMSELDTETKCKRVFIYLDTIAVKSNYTKSRLARIGLRSHRKNKQSGGAAIKINL